MATRLWNYVATFSNLSGRRLAEIYTKLKEDPVVAVLSNGLQGTAAGTSEKDADPNLESSSGHDRYLAGTMVGSNAASWRSPRSTQGDSQTWRRRRAEVTNHNEYGKSEDGRRLGVRESSTRKRFSRSVSNIYQGRQDGGVDGGSDNPMSTETCNHGSFIFTSRS
eukprot:TRINITY_DN13274_c0_g1_i1.p1 TRINITY_DN13274_c0_g1~~TRINITY_DN13274_c0_g1_i1.p1  ORF type:complete len:176 (-),score=4.54 TRINITY_DN13274_c0_g1_i1:83-577(-)